MKTISVSDLKAHWSRVEAQLRNGETFEVLNRGKPAALIVPPWPRRVFVWDDHLATAATSRGRTVEEVVDADRDGRW
ncbi:MAG: type II toxin-antitoxin system Phd/YefM family antitoxin [Spirochaetaceae bacterium]|nr:MAG: type II toxin-antitoxin system Phd/YefM family antitoxin [Spirochaetaceae bacterium]